MLGGDWGEGLERVGSGRRRKKSVGWQGLLELRFGATWVVNCRGAFTCFAIWQMLSAYLRVLYCDSSKLTRSALDMESR